jgi:hypothetical protein
VHGNGLVAQVGLIDEHCELNRVDDGPAPWMEIPGRCGNSITRFGCQQSSMRRYILGVRSSAIGFGSVGTDAGVSGRGDVAASDRC